MSNTVWINEFHYDNSGTDTGQFIEIAGLAGTDLTGWSIVLYNGADGLAYSTLELSGEIPNQSNGVGTLSFAYPEDIQNGNPDGIAIYDFLGNLVEFISYEGSFSATDFFHGDTISSVDVGVSESGVAAAGGSIARIGSGSSNSWQVVADDTPGQLNAGQTFQPAPTADYVNLQFPSSTSIETGGTTETIYGQIYEAGLTEPAGAPANVIVQLGYGPVGTDPSTSSEWVWVDATYNVQVGNNDEYMATLTVPDAGTYAYTFRYAIDDHLHPVVYTYGDLDGAGTNPGLTFDTDQLGTLTVNYEVINGTESADIINGDGNAEIINGLGDDDQITGGGGHDRIFGGAGNDTIFADDAWVEGGLGDDFIATIGTVSYENASGSVQVNLEAGTATGADGSDTIADAHNIVGSDFDDTLIGDNSFDHNNVIDGGAGNDLLDGGDGFNELHGGDGIDTVSYANAAFAMQVMVNSSGGDSGASRFDWLYSIENVIGSAFDDLILGDSAANVLQGGAGDDDINGDAGDDTLDGGAGADVITGGEGNDTATYASAGSRVTVSLAIAVAQDTTGAGTDTLTGIENLTGTNFNDTLTGDSGANILNGGIGNDSLTGGNGDDILEGGNGIDTVTGGSGLDTASYEHATTGVTVSLAIAGAQGTVGAGTDTLVSIENLTGSTKSDHLTGNTAANELRGLSGNDVINGGGGADMLDGADGVDTLNGGAANDVLTGGAANDKLDGGTGDDAMTGGAGDDLYFVDSAGDSVSENSGEGTDTVRSTVTFTLGANVEALQIIGSADVNGTGNELANTIRGNGGANMLIGEAGTDTLNGAGGDDTFDGGSDRDIYTGGTGADLFVYRDGDTTANQTTADKITDFSTAEGDKIDLHFMDANSANGASDDAFTFIGTAAFSHTAGELRYEVISGFTFVSGDMDGDGVADMVIRLAGAPALAATDFVL